MAREAREAYLQHMKGANRDAVSQPINSNPSRSVANLTAEAYAETTSGGGYPHYGSPSVCSESPKPAVQIGKASVVDAALGDELSYEQFCFILANLTSYDFTAEELALLNFCAQKMRP